MPASYQPHEQGNAFEIALAAYLRALGFRTFSEASRFTGRGAPLIDAARPRDAIVMPDVAAMRDGRGAWFDSKWKSESTATTRKGGLLVTGIDQFSYDNYRAVERESGWPVVLVFAHRKENEVRCGTLDQLDLVFAHRCSQQQFPSSKGGMRFWRYLEIPYWMKYVELEYFVAQHRQHGRLAWPPSDAPVSPQLRPVRPEVQMPLFGAAFGATRR